jgi:hypothetical protein
MFGHAAKAGPPRAADNPRMPDTLHSKLVLVPASSRDAAPGVRRYRLARLALNPEPGAARDCFDHLKRTYD